MGTAERRIEIMRVLCRRRHETIPNLAREFGVSVRTIARDIEILSAKEPIYTQCGRYGGGVYVMEDYYIDRIYMSEKELTLLRKLSALAETEAVCRLTGEEYSLLKIIIFQYTKPNNRKENNYAPKGKKTV